MQKKPIRDLLLPELTEEVEKCGFPAYRAKQLCEWLYKKNILLAGEAKNLPKALLDAVGKKYVISSLVNQKSVVGSDSSKKYLFKTMTGDLIESVYIRHESKRHSLCLTTQVGCKIQCRFCASGKGGWVRNLSGGEILDQVACVSRDIETDIDNIVYMGMGEPLDNLEAVLRSIQTLRATWGYQFGSKRITVSTSGLVPQIEEFAKRAGQDVKLAISLHATTDAVRNRLMPINRAYPLAVLMKCLAKVHQHFKRDFTLEYLLIKGVNDSLKDAERLVKLAKPIHAKVNMICFNKIEGESFEPPTRESVKAFQRYLTEAGLTATVRYSAGDDIAAACGQLRLQERRQAH